MTNFHGTQPKEILYIPKSLCTLKDASLLHRLKLFHGFIISEEICICQALCLLRRSCWRPPVLCPDHDNSDLCSSAKDPSLGWVTDCLTLPEFQQHTKMAAAWSCRPWASSSPHSTREALPGAGTTHPFFQVSPAFQFPLAHNHPK